MTDDNIDWSAFKAPTSGDGEWPERVRWTEPGITITGTISRIRVVDFGDGPNPALTLDTKDGDREIIASQKGLQRLLAEHAPHVGDKIRVKYTGDQLLSGGRTLKVFDVQVKAGERPAPAPEPVEDDDIF